MKTAFIIVIARGRTLSEFRISYVFDSEDKAHEKLIELFTLYKDYRVPGKVAQVYGLDGDIDIVTTHPYYTHPDFRDAWIEAHEIQ